MRLARCGSLAILNAVGLVAFAARGDERPVALKDLPAAVRQAAGKAVDGAKWTGAVGEAEDGKTVYRLKGADAKGRKVEVKLSEDGKVQAVEAVLGRDDWKELPVEVRKAAESAVPGAKWGEAVVRAEEESTSYRLKGTDAKGLGVEVTLVVEVRVEVVETALDLKDLPGPLAEVLRPLAGAKWSKATAKAGEGTTYEAVGTDAKGHELTVTIEDDGRSTVRTELELDEVPPVVSVALKAGLPAFRPGSVAMVAEQGAVVYLFEGRKEDEEIRVSVSPDGKTVAVVEDDDDDD